MIDSSNTARFILSYTTETMFTTPETAIGVPAHRSAFQVTQPHGRQHVCFNVYRSFWRSPVRTISAGPVLTQWPPFSSVKHK